MRPIPAILYEALFLDFCNDLRAHLRRSLTDDEVASVFRPEARHGQIDSLQQAGARYKDPYSVADLGAFRQVVFTYRKKLMQSAKEPAINERNWADLNRHFGVIVNIRNSIAHPTDSNCPTQGAAAAAIESGMAVLAMLGLNAGVLRRFAAELASLKPTPPRKQSTEFALPKSGPIFGRRIELGELMEMLVSGSGLVTITGQGGVGKTRLAIAAAEALAPRFGQISFVDLVAAKTWNEGRRLLTRALEARSDSNLDSEEAISSRRRLMVIDNFERLVRDGARDFGAIVKRSEDTTFLVTSRERLGLVSEATLKLKPLVPPRADDSAGDVTANPAVALFIGRVASGSGRYRPGAADIADIAEICRRVGGLPLAVSLAAGHAVERPPGLVLRNLTRFLATRGEIDRPDRQQTMDACLDWSWQFLTKDERAVWRRCSLLLIGGSSETIMEICSFGGLSRQRVETAAAGLVRHSLMELDDQRYRLPELVRHYGLDRLSGFELKRLAIGSLLWATSLVNRYLHDPDSGDLAVRHEAVVQAATAQSLLSPPTIVPVDVALRFLVSVARLSSEPHQVFGQWASLLLEHFDAYKPQLLQANLRVGAEAALATARLRAALGSEPEAEADALFAVQTAVRAGSEDLVLGAIGVYLNACNGQTPPRRKLFNLLARQPRSRIGLLAMSKLAFPGYPDEAEEFDWDFAVSGLCRVAAMWLRASEIHEVKRVLADVQFAITVFDLPERHRRASLRLLEQLPDRWEAARALVDWAEALLGLDDVRAIDQLQPERPYLANRPRAVLQRARKLLIRAIAMRPLFAAATTLALVESDLGHADAAVDALQLVLKEPAPDGDGLMLVARLSALMVGRPDEYKVSDEIWHRLLHWGANWLRSNGNGLASFAVDSVATPGTKARRTGSRLNQSERAMALKSIDGLPVDGVFKYLEAEAKRIVSRQSAERRSSLGIKVGGAQQPEG